MLIAMRRSSLRAISRSQKSDSASRMVSQLAPGRLVHLAVELIADRGQLEPVQHLDEVIVVHHHRPPTSRSYSSSGRSSSASAA